MDKVFFLSYRDFSVISNLNGPQKQSVLVSNLGFTPGVTVNTSSRLTELGYAERTFDERDRRVICMKISDRGDKVYLEVFKAISETEIQQFYSSIKNYYIKVALYNTT